MKKYILSIAFLALPLFVSSQEPVERIYKKITDPNDMGITVVAHRADGRTAPENSLAAIDSSIRQGADVV